MKRLLLWTLILMMLTPALAEGSYDEIKQFEDYFFGRIGKTWQLYDADGNRFVDHIWSAKDFAGGFSFPFEGFKNENAASIRFGADSTSTYGAIDRQGNIILEPKYDFVYSFSCGRAVVKMGNKTAFVDDTGRLITDFIFTEAYSFRENLAAVCLNGKWGFIDAEGSMVIEPIYEFVASTGFSNGACTVYIDNKYAIIDSNGAYIIPPIYDYIAPIEDGYAIFEVDNHYGLLNSRGEIIMQPMYDSFFMAPDNVYLRTFNGQESGFIIKDGEICPIEIIGASFNPSPYLPYTGSLVPRLESEASLTLTGELPRLDCARELLPVCSGVVEALYPESTTCDLSSQNEDATVACNNNRTAFYRLLEGKADVIFTTPPLDSQTANAEEAGKKLRVTPIGREALLFFVNESNPIEGLTFDQIRAIYGEDIVLWKDLGAPSLGQITAYQHPTGSASQSLMEGIVLSSGPNDYFGFSFDSDGGVSSYRNFPNALGYILRFHLKNPADRGVKVLSIDGVFPTNETIADGSYPASVDLCAVTLESNDNPNVAALLEWLQAPQGQELIQKSGYVPISQCSASK